jgi:hypothetical protein
MQTDYGRELLGGGEGGVNTCKTSSCLTATAKPTVSAGTETTTVSDRTYTLLLTSNVPCSWQQDILHAVIPAPRECSHSVSFFVEWLFPADLLFPCPCGAHIFPSQHAIPRAIHADAHIGAHSSNTATRHTHAPTVLPGAIGAWSERFISPASRIPEPPATFHILDSCYQRSELSLTQFPRHR